MQTKRSARLILTSLLVVATTILVQAADIPAANQEHGADATTTSDFWGWSVDIDGDNAIIGAPLHNHGGSTDMGGVYLFTRSGSTWTEDSEFHGADIGAFHNFGRDVAIDGNFFVAGADNGPGESVGGAGSVYVFENSGGWSEVAKLNASDEAALDDLGYSVDIDGDYVIAGAPEDGTARGAAYIWVKPGGGWADADEDVKLTASDAADNDDFGFDVGITADGYAIVGAYEDHHSTFDDAGSAYIYVEPGGGWSAHGGTEDVKLTASDAAAHDNYGVSVDIDSTYAVVGSNFDDDNGSSSGSVYVYEKDEGGVDNWGELKKITPADGEASDQFGRSVYLEGDELIVGSTFNEVGGSMYRFLKDDGGADNFGEIAEYSATDAAASDEGGYSVAISGDWAVMSSHKDDDQGTNTGAVYIFDIALATPIDGPTDLKAGDYQGTSITFTWTDAPTETSYKLYRNTTDTQPGTETYTIAADSVTFTDNGISAGTDYFYWLTADDGSKESDPVECFVNGLTGGVTPCDYNDDDNYGDAVSVSGDWAAISSPRNGDGRVFMFKKTAGAWNEFKTLEASDDGGASVGGSFFEYGHTLHLDGDYLIVGSENNDGNGTEAGAAYIYEKDEGGAENWGEVRKFEGASAGDRLGEQVSITSDGYAIASTNEFFSGGIIYVYDRTLNGGTWGIAQTINEAYEAVTIDGETAAISNDGDDVSIREKDEGGADNWGEVTTITEPTTGQSFGNQLSLDTDTLAVGQVGAGDGSDNEQVYIYERDNGGVDNWGLTQTITEGPFEEFGGHVALHGDYLAVLSGSTQYLYERDEGGVDNWGEVNTISGTADAFSGRGIDISAADIFFGNEDDDSVGFNSGAAQTYTIASLLPPPDAPTDFYVDDDGATFTLRWEDNSSDEVNFNIYQASTDTQPGTATYTPAANATSQAIGGALPFGGFNHFWITAENAVGTESATAEFCVSEPPFNNVVRCDSEDFEQFGIDVAIDGDYAVVGARFDDEVASDAGSAYVFRRGGDVWNQVKKLTASDGESNDEFGDAVDISGDKIIVGAPFEDGGAGDDIGAAYVFERDLGGTDNWGERAKLEPTTGEDYGEYGTSVAIDGDYAIVGAPYEDSGGCFADDDCGVAYVHYKDEGGADAWDVDQQLDGNFDPFGEFGRSVDTSNDGEYFIIGAPYEDGSDTDSGYAHIYDGAYSVIAIIEGSDAEADDNFGFSVSISGDYAIAGAPFEDASGNDQGAAYIFYKDEGGVDNWGEQKKLTASDADDDYYYGSSVAVDAGLAVVGADGANGEAGQAYAYSIDFGGTDNWGEVELLPSGGTAASDAFGRSIDTSGSYVIVGTPLDNLTGADEGSTYIYPPALFGTGPDQPGDFVASGFDGSVATLTWTDNSSDEVNFNIYYDTSDSQPGIPDYTPAADATSQAVTGLSAVDPNYFWLTAEDALGVESTPLEICLRYTTAGDKILPCEASQEFGYSIAVDGDFAIVGAPLDDTNGEDSGAAFIFERNGDTWNLVKFLVDDLNGADFYSFGEAVDIEGDYAVVGSPFADPGSGDNEGVAYIFYRNQGGADQWGVLKTLTGDSGADSDEFGAGVGISGDVVVVGAQGVDTGTGSGGFDEGQVDIFYQDNGGTDNWGYETSVSDGSGEDFENFGYYLDLDGDTLIVGSPFKSNAATGDGAAFVFYRDGFGGGCPDCWEEIAVLEASDADDFIEFGFAVSTDSDRAIVGAPSQSEMGDMSGAAYIYERDEGCADCWGEVSRLISSDYADGDYFGGAVDIVGDQVVVGAPFSTLASSAEGKAYLFNRNQGGADNWGELNILSASDAEDDDSYGQTVGIATNHILVTAPYEDELGSDAGALYFFDLAGAATVTGGSPTGSSSRSCSVNATRIDLPSDLTVTEIDGVSTVEINWTQSDLDDFSAPQKVQVLFDYIDQNPSPELDGTGKELSAVFTRHLYDVIMDSNDPGVIEAFDDSLHMILTKPSDSLSEVLKGEGIEYNNDFFSDWWTYLFFDMLASDPVLAEVFIETLQKELNEPEISYERLIRSLLDNFAAAPKSLELTEVASCMETELVGLSLQDFVPGKLDSVYENQNGTLRELLDQIIADGDILPILEGLKTNSRFLESTQNSLDIGLGTLLFNWKSDSNIQEIMEFFKADASFREFKDVFFGTQIVKDLESCVKSAYKRELLDIIEMVQLNLVKSVIERDVICNEHTADLLMQATKKAVNRNGDGEKIEDMILDFINDILFVEKALSDSGHSNDFSAYFNDQFDKRGKLSDDVTLEIYRDTELIQSIDNPNTTSFIDETVPANESGRVVNHDYYIKTRTACDAKTGSKGTASINPQLPADTSIEVTSDVNLRLKDGFNLLFIEKLEKLINASLEKNKAGLQITPDPVIETQADTSLSQVLTLEEDLLHRADNCVEAGERLGRSKLRGSDVFDYILACHGNLELDDFLREERQSIVPPLIIALRLNSDAANKGLEDAVEPSEVIDSFMQPILDEINQEIFDEAEVFEIEGNLAKVRIPTNISHFSEEEKELIKCGGIVDCSEDTREIIRTYFEGSSHSASILVEVYDSDDNLVHSVQALTDIFGEAKDLELGTFLSGRQYTVKVRLEDEQFVLPKISTVTLNTAEPSQSGGFEAHLDFIYRSQFRFGNFDESDDVINLDDVKAWGKLITENPELWSESNLDGLYGVDLFDALTLQGNWGQVLESRLEDERITLMELAELFGLVSSSESRLQVPGWLNLVEHTCQ